MRILDKDAVVVDLDKLGMADARARALRTRLPRDPRRRARDRPDRLGQVDDALRGAAACSTRRRRTSSRSRTRSSTRSTGITQIQVNPKAGLTFATGLRAMVRADPDVIMVGEIRDRETAQIADRVGAHRPPRALDAAHQRRAVGDHAPDRDGHRAVPRRLGARLRRRPAPRAHAVPALQAAHDHPGEGRCSENGYKAQRRLEAYEPVGCRRCGGTRLPRPRRALRGDDDERRRSGRWRSNAGPPRRSARSPCAQGMRRLRDDGLEKVRQGRTSIAEIARVIGSN